MKLLLMSYLFCFSCSRQEDKYRSLGKGLPDLDFSYNDTFSTTFSIKTSNSDTIYIKQHFSGEESKIAPGMYYIIVNQQVKDKLWQYLDQIRFSQLDTLYDENIKDGGVFKLCTRIDGDYKCILVNSEHAPRELKQLAYDIVDARRNWMGKSIDTTIYFASEKYIHIPMQKVNLNDFLPPD